jgi:hypothetical protein
MRTPIATGSDNDLFGWRLGRSDERGSLKLSQLINTLQEIDALCGSAFNFST